MSETPTHFIAVCPHCLANLRIPSGYGGQDVQCNHCGQRFHALSPDFPITPGSGKDAAGAAGSPAAVPERLVLSCPHCGSALRVRREYAGHQVRCAKCGETFPVPLAAEPPVGAGAGAGPPAASPEPDLFDRLYAAQDESRSPGAPREIAPAGAIEEQLAALGGERDRLRVELELLRREQESFESEREQIRAERDRIREDGAATQEERDALRAELDRLKDDLARAESEREGERQAAGKLAAELAAIKEALGPIPPGEVGTLRDEHATFRSQADDLRRQVESLESELSARDQRERQLDEDRRRALEDSERARADEHRELTEQLRLARDQLAEAEAQAAAHRSRAEDLRLAREALEADHRRSLDAERSRLAAEHESALEAERRRHAEELASARALAEEGARLADRLKAEIVSLSQARSAPEADLAAAREEIAELRKQLAENELTRRSMSSLLEGMGIRMH